MNFKLKPETKEAVIAFSLSGIIIVTFYLLISNISILTQGLGALIRILMPFLYGIFFSFLLMPLRDMIEDKWLKNTKFGKNARRRIAVAGCMIFLLLVIVGFFSVLIPQLSSSIQTFVRNISQYLRNAETILSNINGYAPDLVSTINSVLNDLADFVTSSLTDLNGGLGGIVMTISSVVNGVINFFIGLIITI